jgi:carbamoyltransferase
MPVRHYQLFVPNNPYFPVYTVNEEVFRGLELILRRDVRLSELSAPCSQEWIFDLIYRGLVYVSSEPLRRCATQL